jgi:hypothetical protein
MVAPSRGRKLTGETRAAQVLRKAQALANSVESWADFANALFDAEHGIVAAVFPDQNDRRGFFHSKEYRTIDGLLSQLMQRFGVADGATPKETGRFVVRLPRTIRLTLEREAAREGVGVNELVLAKLAIPLAARTANGE